jgi:hypothetical protein
MAYVSTYVYFSRVGYAEQDNACSPVFYFSSPYTGGNANSHFTCYTIYAPLIYLERAAGSTRIPAGSWH